MSEPTQTFSQLLGPARRRHRGADPPRRGVPPAALAARAARHAARARAGHGVREGVDAHARQLRDRDVRARRPRAVPADAGLAAGARRADPRHRARAVGLLPCRDDPDVRARTRRRAGRVFVGAGDQRAHRSAAPLPGAGGSADRRAAISAVAPATAATCCRRCARCATPGSATATTWPTRGSRRRASSVSTWRSLVRPDTRRTPPSSLARVRPSAGASRSPTTPAEAAAGRQVISTDVFASMGQEAEAETRLKTFAGFTIDRALMAVAAPDAVVLHCLPAHRGEEISDEVIEGAAEPGLASGREPAACAEGAPGVVVGLTCPRSGFDVKLRRLKRNPVAAE